MTQNLVLIQGRVGQDPELRSAASGTAYCHLSIATEYSTKKDGEWIKVPVWHRVTCFGNAAEFVAEYAKKGSAIGISGHLSYSKHDKDGEIVYQTSIIVDEVTTLVAPSGQSGGSTRQTAKRYGKDGNTALPQEPENSDTDIPF